MKNIKIALAQVNPTVADLKGNLEIILNQIKKAKQNKVNILVFPEMVTTGYPIKDLIYNNQLISDNIFLLKKIQFYSKDFLAIIIGSVFKSSKYKKFYQRYYNGYIIFSYGKILNIGKKVCLPNYSVFDEMRYFIPGKKVNVIKLGGISFSTLICEDLWYNKKKHPIYPFSPLEKLSNQNLDFIFSLNASPFQINNHKKRKKIICQQSKKYNIPIFYLNIWGLNDQILFDGNSFITDNKGNILLESSYFSDDLLCFSWEIETKSIIVPKIEKIKNYSKYKLLYQAMLIAKKEYHKKSNISKSVIGISGGIDSAVALSIDVKALGSKNVIAILSPSRYTSKKSLNAAITLCQNFKVKYYIIPIEEKNNFKKYSGIFPSKVKRYLKTFKTIENNISIENQQAIDRMSILRFISNEKNAIITGTSNKAEIALGYGTLCGDLQADLLILGDLYKFEIYKLAKYINKKNKNEIPSFIIEREPSSELAYKQIDPFDYNKLDRYIYLSIEKLLSDKEILKHYPDIFSSKLLKYYSSLIEKNEYKRKNSSLVIRFHKRSFSDERKIPILKKITFLSEK